MKHSGWSTDSQGDSTQTISANIQGAESVSDAINSWLEPNIFYIITIRLGIKGGYGPLKGGGIIFQAKI